MLKKQRGAKGEKAISLTEEISSVKATSVFTQYNERTTGS